LAQREESVQDLADGAGDAGADVIDLAGFSFLQTQPVGLDDVADIVEIALGVEIADVKDRLLLALSISAICLAKEEVTNTSPRLGPVWLKPRVRTMGRP
jgi:hypothetical protein